MFFQKNKLRKKYNHLILQGIDRQKQEIMIKKEMVERGMDVSEDVVCDFKIAQAKYFFYLGEAKNRQIKMSR